MSATGEPEQPDLLLAVIEAALREVHVSLIAHVVRFYPERRAADVRPVVRSSVASEGGGLETEEMPVIQNVPLGYVIGGGWQQTFPLSIGDPVRLLFSENYTGGYRRSGKSGQEPGLLSRFDLSSAVAFPIDERDGKDIEVSLSDWIVKGPGVFRVGESSAQFVALANKVNAELGKIADMFASFLPGTGGASFPAPYEPDDVSATKLKSE